MKKKIIFDLDGTLVDSASAILNGLAYAKNKINCDYVMDLNYSLIGPPLDQTLLKLVGNDNRCLINELTYAFKEFYDDHGYKITEPYDGVSELLKELFEFGFCLNIGTNKRMIPTMNLLDFFGWSKYFNRIYTIDSVLPCFLNKSFLIKELLNRNDFKSIDSVYIGDTAADEQAAYDNCISFIFVDWGYGRVEDLKPRTSICSSVDDLKNKLIYTSVYD